MGKASSFTPRAKPVQSQNPASLKEPFLGVSSCFSHERQSSAASIKQLAN